MIRHFSFILAPLVLLTLVACSDSTTEPTFEGTFTAEVNGSTFTAIHAAGYEATEQFAVSGQNAAGASVGFSVILKPERVGTYTVGTQANGTYVEGTVGWTTAGGSGTFEITSYTEDRVAGTFSFEAQPNTPSGATGTISVTNGRFDVPMLQD